MEKESVVSQEFANQIQRFSDECIKVMYKGHDHIIAKKYYLELFNELIPKYFCICKKGNSEKTVYH